MEAALPLPAAELNSAIVCQFNLATLRMQMQLRTSAA
jgi:hypothetical protein